MEIVSTNLPLRGPSRAFEQLVINLEKIICTISWIIVLASRWGASHQMILANMITI